MHNGGNLCSAVVRGVPSLGTTRYTGHKGSQRLGNAPVALKPQSSQIDAESPFQSRRRLQALRYFRASRFRVLSKLSFLPSLIRTSILAIPERLLSSAPQWGHVFHSLARLSASSPVKS